MLHNRVKDCNDGILPAVVSFIRNFKYNKFAAGLPFHPLFQTVNFRMESISVAISRGFFYFYGITNSIIIFVSTVIIRIKFIAGTLH